MTNEASQLLKLLSNLKRPLSDKELANVVSYVDKHGARFELLDVAAIRTKLLEVTGLTLEELAAAFERGTHKLQNTQVDDFSHLLPERGLLPEFVKMTGKTEWATPFRAFSLLGVLGALLGRQVYIDRNVYRIWPNIALLLIGPTGVRKTTCIEFAMRLAIEADSERFLSLEKITSEAIHTWLAQRDPAVGVLYAPELSTVINKKDYTKNLINDLTRLWDCPDELRIELVSRKEVLRNVALSFLAASNEEWLLRSLPEDAHKGGFLARMLQIYVGGFEKFVSSPAPVDELAREGVVRGLVETKRCQGVVTLTRQAELYFDKRYREVRSELLGGTDPRIAAFLNRHGDHMLRLAMLLSISEERVAQVYITDAHLACADGMLGWVVKWLPKIYTFTSLTDAGEDARRVLYVISRSGGRISRKRLIAELYGRVSVDRLDGSLRTLRAADFVRESPSVLFDAMPGSMYYTLTERALQEV